MVQAESVSSGYAVNSEVGRLRKVLVCAPGLARQSADTQQLRRAVVRRRDVGAERET